MLREAALAVRPGQAYFGTLGHIEGSTYVLDATSDDDAHRFLQVGLRTEVSNLLLARDLKGGRTQSWQDCQLDTELPTTAREIGLRSQIATQFSANETLYVLALASLEPPSENRSARKTTSTSRCSVILCTLSRANTVREVAARS